LGQQSLLLHAVQARAAHIMFSPRFGSRQRRTEATASTAFIQSQRHFGLNVMFIVKDEARHEVIGIMGMPVPLTQYTEHSCMFR